MLFHLMQGSTTLHIVIDLLDINKVTPAFYLDFGKYKVDYSEVEPNDGVVAINKKLSRKEYVSLWEFQVCSDFLMLGLGFNEKTSLCFYSLKTGKIMNGVNIVDDMYLKNNILKLKSMITCMHQ